MSGSRNPGSLELQNSMPDLKGETMRKNSLSQRKNSEICGV